MKADDPRHGGNAGYQAHLAAGEKACPECLVGRRKYMKRRRIARENGAQPYFPIGRHFWRMTVIYRAPDLVAAGAVSQPSAAYEMRRGGPDFRVREATLRRFAEADTSSLYTPIGLQRRLRGLAVMGYTLGEVAEATGMARSGLIRYRNQGVRYSWGGHPERIVKAYDDLHASPKANPTRWEVAAMRDAKRRGWAPPLAWDNIDDPDEQPTGIRIGDPRDLLGDYEELREAGESIEHAAARLGVTPGAIERAQFRARGRVA